MKIAWAILSSLMLIGTSFLSASAAPCAKPAVRSCCQAHCQMACCKANPAPKRTPVIPASNPQIHPAIPLTATIQELPGSPVVTVSTDGRLLSPAVSLYARHCALLL